MKPNSDKDRMVMLAVLALVTLAACCFFLQGCEPLTAHVDIHFAGDVSAVQIKESANSEQIKWPDRP